MNKSSWESLKRKLKQITKKTRPYSFEERLGKLREVWMGWVNNYRLASIHAKLKQIDEWLRNRLRYCIWSRWRSGEKARAKT
ncbi:group II intron maturase-specific domain-containing protein [Pleomorphovibrio marinus]|uniref:group II intron maturase-specific domain-containing protein n=1 Tax=Pleomorphovibrio marinus TaxID=2164132 RepID=UPI001E565C37|nr:group II intron maturase-specific domain-containing protein [Pleomorphovibrio marinus]